MELVIFGYAVLRLVLAYVAPSLWSILDSYVELSTPMSSFTRLKEGLFLYNILEVNPYNGGPFHQSPLLLSLFSAIPQIHHPLIFILIDAFGAYQLSKFARVTKSFSASTLAAVYLLNPFSLLSSLAQSTNTFTNALICATLGSASARKPGQAMVYLGLSTVISYYPIYFVLSVIGICQKFTNVTTPRLVIVFLASIIAFLLLAYLPLGSWEFLNGQFGTLLFLGDLTRPNVGVWWYFFIELFDVFRGFFLGAFQLFLGAFPMPLTVRFPKQPLFTLTCLIGLHAVFKPYPEASDLGLYLTLLALDRPVFRLLEYKQFEALGLFYTAVLAPTFYYLWIYVGSGNANFFYAVTLVYSITMVMLLADSTWAAIRLDYDGGRSKTLAQM